MGSQHVAGQGKAVFLPRQMLEHVLGHKTGVFLTGQVLGWGDARSGPGMTGINNTGKPVWFSCKEVHRNAL
jgi:hypothetical protein